MFGCSWRNARLKHREMCSSPGHVKFLTPRHPIPESSPSLPGFPRDGLPSLHPPPPGIPPGADGYARCANSRSACQRGISNAWAIFAAVRRAGSRFPVSTKLMQACESWARSASSLELQPRASRSVRTHCAKFPMLSILSLPAFLARVDGIRGG